MTKSSTENRGGARKGAGAAKDKANGLRRISVRLDPASEAYYKQIALEKYGKEELSLGIRVVANQKI